MMQALCMVFIACWSLTQDTPPPNPAAPTSSPPTTTPAAPPILTGPDAVEDGGERPTLVQRTFDGRVENVGPEPDMLAIGMLNLTDEQRAKFNEIRAARMSAFDQIVRLNYGLMLELAALQGESNPRAAADVVRRLTEAFKPYNDRGPFFREMWPHLDDAQRAQAQAMVNEYREARMQSMRNEAQGAAPAAIAMRERFETFGQMVRESIERQIGLEREQFEQLAEQLALTPEQRNAAEAIFQPLAIKRFQNIEVPREEQAAAFAEFNKLLNTGQKQKVLGLLLRQYQPPPSGTAPKPPTSEIQPKAYKAEPGPLGVAERLMTLTDTARNRDVPVKVYLPKDSFTPQPVIVFSHGWGGNREGSAYLAQHWASHGYVCVMLEHEGSDTDLIRSTAGDTLAGMRVRIAQALRDSVNDQRNWVNRAKDVTFTLDELQKRSALHADELFGRLDLARVGMSGHSFGAYTTMLIMGATIDVNGLTQQSFRDPRCIAGIAMSPQGEGAVGLTSRSWQAMTAPMLYLTGDKDWELGTRDASGRRTAFDRTPADSADQQMLIMIADAEHMAFSDNPRGVFGEAIARDPRHHQWILMATTAFWDAHLRKDAAAQAWLDSDALKVISAGACAVERK